MLSSHRDDAVLTQIPHSEVDAMLPAGHQVNVLRVGSRDEGAPTTLERWSRAFVLGRLKADGAYDASPIIADPSFGIATRTRGGELLFVQTAEVADG